MKICSKCRARLPLTQFETRVSNGKQYPHSHCKDCRRADHRGRSKRADGDGYLSIPYGERSHASKLTDADIRLIKGLLASGLTCSEIAHKFEVSRQTVSGIKPGHCWSHVA